MEKQAFDIVLVIHLENVNKALVESGATYSDGHSIRVDFLVTGKIRLAQEK